MERQKSNLPGSGAGKLPSVKAPFALPPPWQRRFPPGVPSPSASKGETCRESQGSALGLTLSWDPRVQVTQGPQSPACKPVLSFRSYSSASLLQAQGSTEPLSSRQGIVSEKLHSDTTRSDHETTRAHDAKADWMQIHSAGSDWFKIVDGYPCVGEVNARADLAVGTKPPQEDETSINPALQVLGDSTSKHRCVSLPGGDRVH